MLESVLNSDFETQFLLNFLENYKISERDKPMKPTKTLERVLQNIHNLDEVNKLKLMWKVNNIFEGGN